ncbi:alkaline phosphatase family protein [Natronorubrum daqingense]|uniref:Alkaline phosphatase family protein n=1 Tax=Natronorubrum daqingense TaxID=588898 RepID=A0A1N7G8N0_9EURY|nr:nucleotide pyrophosphatase/phosphodiesterase family protein [Natronorubrum daqingense]APX97284.1 alkaline phosphatase family protein [Natronorubrum daqingense]SIS08927.1 Type I phosphodiesterase / nucleotide pyrophosphatase [Natronorubrum daqingense]
MTEHTPTSPTPPVPHESIDADRIVVLDVVGLQPHHVDDDRTPALAEQFPTDQMTDLRPPFPALTVPAQTTLATGTLPRDHGDVSSGEYDRERDVAELWERDRADRNRIWEYASDEAGLTTGVLNFQHLIGTSADVALTPSPIEDEDNNILEMNCWTNPDGFYDDLREAYGHFPLHSYWGPGASAESSEWILTAAREAVERFDPDLLWVYVPHLDYVGQSDGPEYDAFEAELETVDGLLSSFLDFLAETDRWDDTLLTLVSEYGFHGVDQPVFPNRALREAGLLETADDGDVDIPTSDAFAMVDHQIAHVYADEDVQAEARDAVSGLEGVDEILDEGEKSDYGIDHPNAGDLVLVAEETAWFQYYWWDDRADAPPYATDMDIHKKPGFDPCELFFGEDGLVSLDPTKVGGSHGRVDDSTYGCFGLGGPAASGLEDETVDATAVTPFLEDVLGLE